MEIDNNNDKPLIKNSVEAMNIDNKNNNTMIPKEITQKPSIPIDIQSTLYKCTPLGTGYRCAFTKGVHL